ncbi:MAG: hypothetical protein JOY64_27250 [Alphaproteobacteria bacterium]|nr:hypothetical protein [Alphaproteobacteria bacterium]MBV8411354.1 hypothetical protein [Alphaproteobacteria bacterium]
MFLSRPAVVLALSAAFNDSCAEGEQCALPIASVMAPSLRDVGPIGLPKADPAMLDIARRIIEQQAGKFDPGELADRYEVSLRALPPLRRGIMPPVGR